MQASEIRDTVRSDHAELRVMLNEIEELAGDFQKGEAALAERLRARGLALYERFLTHLELEDRLLKPALLAAGDTGARGARHLEHEHHEQRELIQYLLGRLEKNQQPTLLIARELQSFVEYLRLDMNHEESDLLTDEVLGATPGSQ